MRLRRLALTCTPSSAVVVVIARFNLYYLPTSVTRNRQVVVTLVGNQACLVCSPAIISAFLGRFADNYGLRGVTPEMKAASTCFLHLFMAVTVLLSSMGFGVVDHTCQMRGKRTYLIHRHSKACEVRPAEVAEQATGPVIKRTACCIEKARYEKVDIGSSLSYGLANIDTVAEGFVTSFAPVFTPLFGLFVAHSAALSTAVCDPPAPPFGRTLLVFVQSFLI